MCGITGLVDSRRRSDRAILRLMTDALSHRGPDDEGVIFQENERFQVGLGHRRLSILDLSPLGHQPMLFQGLQIVYNGEVYNFFEIQQELKTFGYTFESSSDTEVILKAYHKWGFSCVERFIGMFAFAILDEHNQKLVLCRDRAGVKPLYFYFYDGLLLFASELKSFHQHPAFKKELDFDALSLYLQYGYIPAPHCIFKHTWKVKPGHFIDMDLATNTLREVAYWDVVGLYNRPKINISEGDALEEVERLLHSAFQYRMVADVPVGVFLSGGYDSSAVTALLQSKMTEKIKTFTIGFHEKEFDEAPHAKMVAEHLGTDHTEYYCTQKDALGIIDYLPDMYDEPFGDSSAIPTALVSRLARQSVTVSLSADGGDEIFSGYDKYVNSYKRLCFYNCLPGIGKKFLLNSLEFIGHNNRLFGKLITNFPSKQARLKHYLRSSKAADFLKYDSIFFNSSELIEILNVPFLARETYFDEDCNPEFNDPINQMLCMDYKTYLTDDILVKVDRATMFVGLEGREPLLDHRIIDFVSLLPSGYKLHDNRTKYLFKKLVHKYLPEEMMNRPKMGFSVPITHWFRNELKQYFLHYLDEDRLKSAGIFNARRVALLRDRYLSGYPEDVQRLWFLLMFEMWKDKWL